MKIRINTIPGKIDTSIILPFSKSISNRILLISALSGQKTELGELSDSDDSQTMITLLNSANKVKDAGHAGTTMRFLTAFYARGDEEVILTGSERMKNRPIKELVDRLRELGADIEYLERSGYPPLQINGRPLKGGRINIDSGISSQYISAILMIAPRLKGGLELNLTGETISSSYIEMTLSLMKDAGANFEKQGNLIKVYEKPYDKIKLQAEPDWSSASYWFMIAGLHPDARIFLRGLSRNSYQGDSNITAVFNSLGVKSEFWEKGMLLSRSEVGLKEFHYDFRNMPDMVQSFVPYCIAREIPFYLSGCRTLRIKETDRVKALADELKKFGVSISFSEDGDLIWWDGKSLPLWKKNITIKTYQDHRMALGMVPLSIKSANLKIEDPEVVSKSYPSFWKDIEKAGFTISKIE